MSNKDYVKRGQGVRTKAAGAKKKSTQQSKSTQWKLGIFAILALVGIGFGLTKLSSDPSPAIKTPAKSNVSNTKTVSTANPIKAKPPSALPPIPEEKWDYITSLPSKEVEIVVKDQTQDDSIYVMQCGAFKLRNQATERKASIAFQGIQSNVVNDEGSSWYRVVLGPYPSKRAAVRDQHKLQRVKIEPCAIWKKNN